MSYNATEKEGLITAIEAIDCQIGDAIGEKFHKDIIDTIKSIGGDEKSMDGSGRQNLWKLLRKKSIKSQAQVPIGKFDKNGRIVTNHDGLKRLYLNTYIERLRNRPIIPGFEELKDLKMLLFSLRLSFCSDRKSRDWTIDDLEKVFINSKEQQSKRCL